MRQKILQYSNISSASLACAMAFFMITENLADCQVLFYKNIVWIDKHLGISQFLNNKLTYQTIPCFWE